MPVLDATQRLSFANNFIVPNDVSEIYSRPRVTAYATSLGLSPGFALDLAVVDPDDGMLTM